MHDFPYICSLLDSLLVACGKLQVVCGDGGGVNKGARGEALVCRVTAVVPGTSEAAARQALHVASGDYQGAVQYLKVEKLYRSGLVLCSLLPVFCVGARGLAWVAWGTLCLYKMHYFSCLLQNLRIHVKISEAT